MPVALPFDATHLGLRWLLSEGGPANVSVSVRTRKAGRDWSAWEPRQRKRRNSNSNSGKQVAASK